MGNDSLERTPSLEELDGSELLTAVESLWDKGNQNTLDPSKVQSLRWELAGAGDPEYTDVRPSGSPLDLTVKIVPLGERSYRLLVSEGERDKGVLTNLKGWATLEEAYSYIVSPGGLELALDQVSGAEVTQALVAREVQSQHDVDYLASLVTECMDAKTHRQKESQI